MIIKKVFGGPPLLGSNGIPIWLVQHFMIAGFYSLSLTSLILYPVIMCSSVYCNRLGFFFPLLCKWWSLWSEHLSHFPLCPSFPGDLLLSPSHQPRGSFLHYTSESCLSQESCLCSQSISCFPHHY